jgi:hypothetical protein
MASTFDRHSTKECEMTKLSSADIAKYFEHREKLVADTLATPHEIVCAASERCRAAYGAGAGDMHFYHADKWLDAFHQTYAMSGQPWQPMLIALEVMIRNELEKSDENEEARRMEEEWYGADEDVTGEPAA